MADAALAVESDGPVDRRLAVATTADLVPAVEMTEGRYRRSAKQLARLWPDMGVDAPDG